MFMKLTPGQNITRWCCKLWVLFSIKWEGRIETSSSAKNVLKLFILFSYLENNLACFSLSDTTTLVLCLLVRSGALKGGPLWQGLAILAYVATKQCCLVVKNTPAYFSLNANNKKFQNIRPTSKVYNFGPGSWTMKETSKAKTLVTELRLSWDWARVELVPRRETTDLYLNLLIPVILPTNHRLQHHFMLI